jgi:hypothetical protein
MSDSCLSFVSEDSPKLGLSGHTESLRAVPEVEAVAIPIDVLVCNASLESLNFEGLEHCTDETADTSKSTSDEESVQREGIPFPADFNSSCPIQSNINSKRLSTGTDWEKPSFHASFPAPTADTTDSVQSIVNGKNMNLDHPCHLTKGKGLDESDTTRTASESDGSLDSSDRDFILKRTRASAMYNRDSSRSLTSMRMILDGERTGDARQEISSATLVDVDQRNPSMTTKQLREIFPFHSKRLSMQRPHKVTA